MNILLIGGSGNLINKLIIKLKKEKHKVFLITGQRYKNIYYERVYERFDFPYDGESIRDIVKSIKPDVTIFMGALDTNFKWKQEQQDAVYYSSSLVNALMSHVTTGKGRFIYLSTANQFDLNYLEPVTEETLVEESDFYQTAMHQAENICLSYRENRKSDIVVLRMDRLWSVPEKREDINNVCAEMCLEAIQDQEITYNENSSFSWIYDTDAIEYIYRVVRAEECSQGIYQISSGEEITDAQIAELVKEEMAKVNREITLMPKNEETKKCVLSNKAYSEEFGINFFCDVQKIVTQIVNYMLKHEDRFLYAEEEKLTLKERIMKKAGWLIKACIPLLENIVCFFVAYFLAGVAANGGYLSKLDIYLLYVLLFAVVHGQRQAIVSSVLSALGYIYSSAYAEISFQLLLDYNTYIWVAQLFIVGMVVGYMRDQYLILQDERKEEREYLHRKISDMEDIYNSNVRVKDSLELQIVNQTDSIGTIYSITSALDQYMPEEVLFRAAEIFEKLMKTKAVAIYTVGKNGQYARMYTATSSKAKKMGNSVKLDEVSEMIDVLSEGKVFINRSLDEKYPLMASAVFEGDRLKLIIMIWGLPWEAMTLSSANLLAVTTSLLQNAVLRAERYLQALEEKRFSSAYGILEKEAFEGLVNIYEQAQSDQLTEYSLLSMEEYPAEWLNVGDELFKVLRETDYVGFTANGKINILLSNTKKQDAQIVVDRLQTKGCITKIVED